MLLASTERQWLVSGDHFVQRRAFFDVLSELVQVGGYIVVGHVVVEPWPQLDFEGPDRVLFEIPVLIEGREALDAHVAEVLRDLRELGVGSHQVALIRRLIDVREEGVPEEIVAWLALEGMECEQIGGVDSISQELEGRAG